MNSESSTPLASVISYKNYVKGTFACSVQGSVTCNVHAMPNFNIDIAIRQLEKLAFDPLVLLNAKSRFVYSSGNAIYYMAFNMQKKDEKIVQLDVYGVTPMSHEMQEQLKNLLESKLAEYTSGLISEEIAAFRAAATKTHLRSADINFLKQRGKPRSLSVSVLLPLYVSDPLFYLSLTRQLILTTPNVQSCYELLGAGGKKNVNPLSSVYHPACFGHNFHAMKATSAATPKSSGVNKGKIINWYSLCLKSYCGKESTESFDGESLMFKPMLKRKERVEIEVAIAILV